MIATRQMLDLVLIGIDVKLAGLQQLKDDIISELQGLTVVAPNPKPVWKKLKPKRNISPAARKRIGDAQVKRWKAFRKDKEKVA